MMYQNVLLQPQIEQGSGLGCHLYDAAILKGLQVPLCDVDVLMPQEPGHGVDIQTVPQTGLSEVVAGGMGRAADVLSY